jgi:hypothetical protein
MLYWFAWRSNKVHISKIIGRTLDIDLGLLLVFFVWYRLVQQLPQTLIRGRTILLNYWWFYDSIWTLEPRLRE